jgi:1,4-dihydroxy-2-naphthoate octaprenyltransferase
MTQRATAGSSWPDQGPTLAQWVAGARPRTLPISVAPVIAGSGAAVAMGGFAPIRALLALVVSVVLQVGVNFANDYSDGIRGTDIDRVGPMRLVGSGVARPALVKAAAFTSFAIAAIAGLVLVVWSEQWWMLAIGAAAILAAWYYTGGKRPYGYHGFGEIFVFVFFGPVAVGGTALVQTERIDLVTALIAIAIGFLAVAVLVVNNLRDIAGDLDTGKLTLATKMGDRATRLLFAVLIAATAASVLVIAANISWWALLGLAGPALLARHVVGVLRGASGAALLPPLKTAGMADLATAIGLAAGFTVGALV